MNAFLSAAQEKLRQQYLAYAKEKIAPVAKQLESGSLNRKEFLSYLGQDGYLGIIVPTSYGGQGQPLLNLVLFVEAISYYEPGLALTLAAHTAAAELLDKFGSEQQKSRYLPLLAQGEIIGTVAWSEAGAGTDFQAIEMTANKANDKIQLTGKKTWVVSGELCGLMLVLARQDDGNLGVFLIDKLDQKAVKISANHNKLGLQSAATNDVELQHLEVSQESQLGLPGSGVQQVLQATNLVAVILAAAAVGLTESGLEQSVQQARTRKQFGQPIGQFQAIQWKLADMSTESTAARLLTYRAACSKDENPAEFPQHAAMCKWLAGKVACFHSGEAIQILGVQGLSEDSPLPRLYGDAKAIEIAGGTSEFHKMTLVKELEI